MGNSYKRSQRCQFRRFHDNGAAHCKSRRDFPSPINALKSALILCVWPYLPHIDRIIPWDAGAIQSQDKGSLREKRVHLTTYAYGIVSCEGKLCFVIDFHSLFDRILSTEYRKRGTDIILVQWFYRPIQRNSVGTGHYLLYQNPLEMGIIRRKSKVER